MNSKLQEIRDAWDKTSGDGRDENRTRELADAYVAAHPEEFTELAELTQEQCVQSLEVFRNAHLTESEWRVQTWLWHHFEPQNIGGVATAVVRIPKGK